MRFRAPTNAKAPGRRDASLPQAQQVPRPTVREAVGNGIRRAAAGHHLQSSERLVANNQSHWVTPFRFFPVPFRSNSTRSVIGTGFRLGKDARIRFD